MKQEKRSLADVRKDAEELLTGKESINDAIGASLAYFEAHEAITDATKTDVFYCFVGMWAVKQQVSP